MEYDSWRNLAACRGEDTNLWFPPRGFHLEDIVKKSCDSCPVKDECLEYSLHHEHFGYWGGMGERGRRKIRRERGIKVETPGTGFMQQMLMDRINKSKKEVHNQN